MYDKWEITIYHLKFGVDIKCAFKGNGECLSRIFRPYGVVFRFCILCPGHWVLFSSLSGLLKLGGRWFLVTLQSHMPALHNVYSCVEGRT